MESVDDKTWAITLSGKEGTEIEYKYTFGTWDFVLKGAECEEVANLRLTLDYGEDGGRLWTTGRSIGGILISVMIDVDSAHGQPSLRP